MGDLLENISANVSDRVVVVVIVAVVLGIIRTVKRKNLRVGNFLQAIVTTICTIFIIFIFLAVVALLLNSKAHFWF